MRHFFKSGAISLGIIVLMATCMVFRWLIPFFILSFIIIVWLTLVALRNNMSLPWTKAFRKLYFLLFYKQFITKFITTSDMPFGYIYMMKVTFGGALEYSIRDDDEYGNWLFDVTQGYTDLRSDEDKTLQRQAAEHHPDYREVSDDDISNESDIEDGAFEKLITDIKKEEQ